MRRWRERAETHRQRGSCPAEGALGGAERGCDWGRKGLNVGSPTFLSPQTPLPTPAPPLLWLSRTPAYCPPHTLWVSLRVFQLPLPLHPHHVHCSGVGAQSKSPRRPWVALPGGWAEAGVGLVRPGRLVTPPWAPMSPL